MSARARVRISAAVLLILMTVSSTAAFQTQPTDTPTPAPDTGAASVTAENVRDLQRQHQIDFDALPDDVIVDSGWFTLSADGAYVVVVRRDGGLVIYDTTEGSLADTYVVDGGSGQPGTVIDVAFAPDSRAVAALHADGTRFYVSVFALNGESLTLIPLGAAADQPVRIWWDVAQKAVWLEVLADSQPDYVARLPLPGTGGERLMLDSAPQADRDAFVRNGRTRAPQAVTADPDGRVRLWDLETGEVAGAVQMPHAPRFSRVDDGNGNLLALVDPVDGVLYLLDFDAETLTPVTEISGELQAVMVNPAGDLVLAAAVDGEPVVIAWIVETGERIDLGTYRECSRQPDMVRLSTDGTTLVIGCDTGLDVWRVSQAE